MPAAAPVISAILPSSFLDMIFSALVLILAHNEAWLADLQRRAMRLGRGGP